VAFHALDQMRLRPPAAARPDGHVEAAVSEEEGVLGRVVASAEQQRAARKQRGALCGQRGGVQHAPVG
jgi:hypothetical protein